MAELAQTRDRILRALRAHGIVDPAEQESHLSACNLQQPVEEVVLERGSIFAMWMRQGGKPGKYAAPLGESPERLGIIIGNRHEVWFRVLSPLTVVQSTAASFPLGIVSDVGGSGGGTQYLLPPNWRQAVEEVD